jgi:HEPN domain-containing protein
MPTNKESLYPVDWLRKAEEDFKRVKARLEEGDIEDAAFHLQQAIEKALKGFLLFKGWRLKKIHDLEALLDDAVKYQSSLEQFRELLQQVTGYYLVERYPGFEVESSEEEVKRAYQQTKSLLSLIRDKIKTGN